MSSIFPRQNISLFIANGSIGIAAFYIINIYAITTTGMGVASVLLYSAALWMMIFDFVFQGMRIERVKLLALILALTGMVLIGQVYDFEIENTGKGKLVSDFSLEVSSTPEQRAKHIIDVKLNITPFTSVRQFDVYLTLLNQSFLYKK